MSQSNVTREAIVAALHEYDDLGLDEFLRRHGFREARTLVHAGKHCDSKAIVGVAHGYATGRP